MLQRHLVLLPIFLLAACIFDSDERKGKTLSGETYTDYDRRFRVTIPENWDAVRADGFPFEIDVLLIRDSANRTLPLIVFEEYPLVTGATAKDFLDTVRAEDSAYAMVPVRMRQGKSLHSITKSDSTADIPYKQRIMAFQHGRWVTRVEFIDSLAAFDSRGEFRFVDSSLTFF